MHESKINPLTRRRLSCVCAALLWLVLASPNAQALSLVAQLTPEQVVVLPGGIDPGGVSTASGTLTMDLNATGDRLDYELELVGLALTEVTAIHIHLAAFGANGPHALNIFGLPAHDDDDLALDFFSQLVAGSYDDGDENWAATGAPDVRDPGDSIKLSDALDLILAGDAYIAVHSKTYPLPNSSELRGQISVVPEPGTGLLVGVGLMGLAAIRRN